MSRKFNQQFSCSKMMLPEHRGSLQRHDAKSRWDQKHRRPVPDEQEQEQRQQILEQALANKQAITITVLTENGRQAYSGIPLRGDPATGTIILAAESGRCRAIRVADVVCLEQADRR